MSKLREDAGAVADGEAGDEEGADGEPRDPTCGFVACPGPHLELALEGSFEEVRRLTASTCRNKECAVTELSSLEESPAPGTGRGLFNPSLGNSEDAALTLWNRDGMFELQIAWSEYDDGDELSLGVIDGPGPYVAGTRVRVTRASGRCCPIPEMTELPYCCPISAEPGDVHLGGTFQGFGSCGPSYDFHCSENWRVETNADGCDVWRYDTRSPRDGEGDGCSPLE